MQLLARLKTFDPQSSYPMMRDYTAAPWEKKFVNGVWYKVTDVAGEYLRTIRQNSEDPRAPLAFDVCTDAEAARLMAREEALAMGLVQSHERAKSPQMPMGVAEAEVSVSREMNQPRPRHELAAAATAVSPAAAPAAPPAAAPMETKAAPKKRTRKRSTSSSAAKKRSARKPS
jgi:hypothetical protein